MIQIVTKDTKTTAESTKTVTEGIKTASGGIQAKFVIFSFSLAHIAAGSLA